jgi:cystathionine gamma-lyase
MGVVALKDEELFQRLKFIQNGMGAIPGPFDSYMAMRGTKTLHLRMQRHEQNAKAIAAFLEAHPKVAKVCYPGLASHPQHEIAKKQTTGFGGMITIWLRGGVDESRRFLEGLKLWLLAESLGGVESLIEHPYVIRFPASLPPCLPFN